MNEIAVGEIISVDIMKIIFLGPPGSGKGTYSIRLSPRLGIPHISTGDIFREISKENTPIGKKVKEIQNKGELVTDDITIKILKQRISRQDCKNGFILDGYPRTMAQVKALEKLTKIDVVINLVIPDYLLIKKMAARRICKNCGDIYNIADIKEQGFNLPAMLPKVDGRCDKCGGDIYQRKDDTEDVICGRLEVYKKQTQPLIDYYRKQNLLLDIEVRQPPETMVEIIFNKLKNIKKA